MFYKTLEKAIISQQTWLYCACPGSHKRRFSW